MTSRRCAQSRHDDQRAWSVETAPWRSRPLLAIGDDSAIDRAGYSHLAIGEIIHARQTEIGID